MKSQLGLQVNLKTIKRELDLPPYQGLWISQKGFLLESLDKYSQLHENGLEIIHKELT